MIIKQMASRCDSEDKPMYPPSLFGYGWGYLPHNRKKLVEDSKRCTNCKALRNKWSCPGRDAGNLFCDAHMFGAGFIGEAIEYR
jgi:hypothetical protein